MSAAGCKFRVSNLLVAGRRVTGETFANSPRRAVINVAAKHAKEFRADVGAAVAGALRDKSARVEALT